ncbi:GntR family transcriptional regulator [Saccharobesus litoralis]|uniref:GntR family transcriptional regulator n=1 Tax=Saccharobesus litoralis TaxID=2172099 RepID=A0A2S0VUM3_9ALTE|nr:S1-like domain-containing RNA-binding protein [Saccharobesus litoralis]AWB67921.1 GntR family transcriptional regulator [Saccharobesus litoralis]
MAKIGVFNTLKAIRQVEFGFFLDGGDEGDILLPNRYVPKDLQIDDEIEVFLYLDSEDRVVATTQKPLAKLKECAYLECVDVNKIGAFLNWGLAKDLMVPYSEQKKRMEPGQRYLVYLYLDKVDQRITATAKVNKYLTDSGASLKANQEVDLLVGEKTDLGYKCVVNNFCWGMIFYSDAKDKNLRLGQKLKAYVKRVREDGRVDLSFNKHGFESLGPLAEKILAILKDNKGYMAISDKSSPELIKKVFGCSKREFKMAIGSLYKNRQILLDKQSIRLADK